MKKYKVEITYIERNSGTTKEMHTTVNGKDTELPKGLRRWLAESYLMELLSKDR